MTKPVVYGIPNCDSIKKARKWLGDKRIDYQFHDYRKDGVDKLQLTKWCKAVGWETLLNRRGSTWRQLSEARKETIDEGKAIDLMIEYPAMIKRPVLAIGNQIHVGFTAADYASFFG